MLYSCDFAQCRCDVDFRGILVLHICFFTKEYAYGGHPMPMSGVFEIMPRDAEDLGEQFKFK